MWRGKEPGIVKANLKDKVGVSILPDKIHYKVTVWCWFNDEQTDLGNSGILL